MEALKEILTSLLFGKPVLIGLGNRIRGDEGAGSLLAGSLKDNLSINVIDAEMSIENYIEQVIKDKPDTVIIVDAVSMNLEPGALSIYSDIEITKNHFSPHGISLQFLKDYLINAGVACLIFIGIQPLHTTLGGELSEPAKEALNKLERIFLNVFKKM